MTNRFTFLNLSPPEQLDKILSFIIYYEFPVVQDKDIMLAFETHLSYLYEILDKLILDGFVKKVDLNKFSITFSGRVFFNNGGYKEQKRTNEIDKRIKIRQDKCLAWGSVYVAIGTIGLLIWEIGKFLFPAVQYYCHCEFVWQK